MCPESEVSTGTNRAGVRHSLAMSMTYHCLGRKVTDLLDCFGSTLLEGSAVDLYPLLIEFLLTSVFRPMFNTIFRVLNHPWTSSN